MNLSLADSGSRLNATVGDIIELSLDENPGTGFRWVLLPTSAVSIENDRMGNTAPVPGAAGRRLLTLRVLERGEHGVQLRCERSWEGAATAVGRFDVTLLVS